MPKNFVSPEAQGANQTPAQAAAYAAHRERAAARMAKLSESGRDIGELPAVVDPARKAAAARNFRAFCESYFRQTFALEWSDDHLRVIAAIEASVLEGGLFAFAMPRGSGKTSLVETAALWALLYGHREMVCIIGADEEHAATMLDSIKIECEINDDLAADFPEVCYPIQKLDRIHQRALGQLYKGKPTHMHWSAKEITFPTLEGSAASGGVIQVSGITGRIRGMSAKRADGKKIRPSLVLIDDPQTDESANSPSQCATREAVLSGAVLGLAGPGRKIAGLTTITVIRRDDLADRLLNRERNPAWQGQRTQLIYEWPTNEARWNEYAELRKAGQRDGRGTEPANEYYRQHQAEMDAGARVAWQQRHNPDELTAVQHCWNIRIDRGEQSFAAEYQNAPVMEGPTTAALEKSGLGSQCVNVPPFLVPAGIDTLTAFVDVQERALYWAVMGFGHQLRGHLLAYGTFPEQPRSYFTLRDIRKTLVKVAGGVSLEAALYAGLELVADAILSRQYQRENDDAALQVGLMLIDANWAQTAGVVRDFARRSTHGTRIFPSHGRFVGASGSTLSDKKPDKGERVGANWRTSTIQKQRHILFDTNAWKSFAASKLRLPAADPQALTLHQATATHEMLYEHLTSEYPVRTEARGRVVDEWRLIPGRDNHWWDCLVGCCVAASVLGVSAIGANSQGGIQPRARKKISPEEMAAKRAALMARMGR
jgi:hypothetical protein